MKNIIFLCLVLPMLSCAQKTIQIATEKDSNLEAQLGESFGILLPSMPGTGYAWALRDPLDAAYLDLVKNEHRPAKEGDIVQGNDYFLFKTLQKGKTEIVLWYVRSWEKNDKADTDLKVQKYTVTIR
jgi:predicted secreted protein